MEGIVHARDRRNRDPDCTGGRAAGDRNHGEDASFGRVDARTATDAWAVGSSGDADYGIRDTLIQRWNGIGFETVASPNTDRAVNLLTGISTLSATEAWAVGFTRNGDFGSEFLSRTLVERWNGDGWRTVDSPDPKPLRDGRSRQQRAVRRPCHLLP